MAQPARQDLSHQIEEFVQDFSIEILPRDRGLIPEIQGYLSPGTSVYVANPPSASLDEVIATAVELWAAGYNSVPHILVRELTGKGHLQKVLKKLRDGGIEQILLLAGDRHDPVGPFTSTLEALETGVIETFDFKKIGIAGHPEGSPYAGPSLLSPALAGKNDYARRTGTDMYIVSQLSFDAANIIKWSKIITAAGNRLPIHVGMAGPTKLRTLLNYGAKCGIGASLRTLTKKASALANLVSVSAPDQLIMELANYRAVEPDCPLVKAHFFSFAGFETTARWASAVAGGHYRLKPGGIGFEVESPT